MLAQKLSPLRLELLKVYSFNPSNDDLLAIKKLLAGYFSKKMISDIRKSIDKNQITEIDLTEWLNAD